MEAIEMIEYIIPAIVVLLFLASGIKIIRPTHRAVIETFGKFTRVQKSGITWIFPLVQKLYSINITEQITEAEPQEIITLDRLNAAVDAQVYYKVKDIDEDIKHAFYNVNNYKLQIIALARTTLRNVIGSKDFKEVNSDRNALNSAIRNAIAVQTESWGIEIVRCELKEINPPKDVQATMNNVIMAANQKTAAIDYATATETKADGEKRARIKEAEGQKQSQILYAEGQAQAIIKVAEADAKKIQVVNEAATKYFVKNAVLLKTLEVNQAALEKNSKIIFTQKGVTPVVVIGDDKVQKTIVPLMNKIDDSSDSS